MSAVDYEAWRERVIGYLDRHRRETDDPALARALQRLTSIAVWVLDQNRYKPHVGAAELREQVVQEINSYLKKMYIDGFGDRALHDAVLRGAELVDEVFEQLILEERTAAQGGARRAAAAEASAES